MKKKVSETLNVTDAAPRNNTRTADVEMVARRLKSLIKYYSIVELQQVNDRQGWASATDDCKLRRITLDDSQWQAAVELAGIAEAEDEDDAV